MPEAVARRWVAGRVCAGSGFLRRGRCGALCGEQRGDRGVGGWADEVAGLDVHQRGAEDGFKTRCGCGRFAERAGALHQGVEFFELRVGEEWVFVQGTPLGLCGCQNNGKKLSAQSVAKENRQGQAGERILRFGQDDNS